MKTENCFQFIFLKILIEIFLSNNSADRKNPEDSLKAIRTESDGAIKKDLLDFTSDNGADGESFASGNDLLLHSTATTNVPSVGAADVAKPAKLPHHRDIARAEKTNFIPAGFEFPSEKEGIRKDQNDAFQEGKNSDPLEKNDENVHGPTSRVNKASLGGGFEVDGSPRHSLKFIDPDSTENLQIITKAAAVNHRHRLIPHRHRKHVFANHKANETTARVLDGGKLIETVRSAAALNHRHWKSHRSVGAQRDGRTDGDAGNYETHFAKHQTRNQKFYDQTSHLRTGK